MAMIDGILMEFDMESATTRRVLERVPDDRWSYQPHAKSMTLQALASHIADNPAWVGKTLNQDQWVMGPYEPYTAQSQDDLLSTFDANVATAREIMAGTSDDTLLTNWQLVDPAGKVMFEAPKIGVLRGFILSHTIHHRGQLSVYLRLLDVPVPSIYGPSADEGI
ncbi:MAG: damage-inducible protein DinB [Candidatus Hydrogenedens sp.]|nr:damage-inducible protein DinB [Candidatus Hydrogenedens sp.]